MARRSPTRAGQVLEEMFRELGIGRTLHQYEVLTSWKSIVGEQIARVTTPDRIDNGVLFVHVTSAPWRAELTARKREILQRIRSVAGNDAVTDIRFR